MAGALRKTMLYLGLAEDEHAVDDDEQYVLGDDELEANMHDYDEPRATPIRRSSNVRQIQQGASELRRITTVHPRSYNDARVIGEAFRAGTPVIMNLSEMDDNDASVWSTSRPGSSSACTAASSGSPTRCSCSRRRTSR